MTQTSDNYLEIRDAGDFIRLEPLNLLYPNADDEWDKKWIRTSVNVKVGVFSGQYVAGFMTTDFEFFRKELQELYDNLTGSAKFEPVEGQLILNIKGDGLGHFDLDCEARPKPDCSLSFTMNFDQTEIKNYVSQLDKITNLFL